MKPMFLPDVENPTHPTPSPWAKAITAARNSGADYPQIWHLFAYRPETTEHLARFTQDILREPAPLAPGMRELIAAFTSKRNDCDF